MTHKLLLVDDELPNLRTLERLFSRDFHCLTASSAAEAIKLLEQHDVAIVITDQRMPQMTGIDLLKHTANLRPHMVRILLTGYTDVETLVEAINCGLVYMYFTKPWDNDDLKLKVSRALEHYENNKKRSSLTLANDRLESRHKETKAEIVNALTDMLRSRDEHAYGHALRVRDYAMEIAERMDLSVEEKEDLSVASLLHHLGQKDLHNNGPISRRRADHPAPVTGDHFECEARLLTTLPELGNVKDIIRLYRENFDGTGVPGGLEADQIPSASRILRVVDEYDTMIQPKASAHMTHDEALRFLSQRSGKQFDPRVITIMSQLSPDNLQDSQSSQSQPTMSGQPQALKDDPFEPSYAEFRHS